MNTPRERVAVYPGSFDPLTNGHVDIILRGARLFDRIIVAILRNAEKQPLFTFDERESMAREVGPLLAETRETAHNRIQAARQGGDANIRPQAPFVPEQTAGIENRVLVALQRLAGYLQAAQGGGCASRVGVEGEDAPDRGIVGSLMPRPLSSIFSGQRVFTQSNSNTCANKEKLSLFMRILRVTPISAKCGPSALVTAMNFKLRIPDTLRIWWAQEKPGTSIPALNSGNEPRFSYSHHRK